MVLLLNIHLGLKFYNGTFIKSWNSLNLHSNFFNYPNKQEAETFGVFIHGLGSKRSKQTKLICQTRESNRGLFDIIKPSIILLLHGSLACEKFEKYLTVYVITYQADTPHIPLCGEEGKQGGHLMIYYLKYLILNEEPNKLLRMCGSFFFFSPTILVLNRVKIGHTARVRRVLGSRSNFSPGASF